MELFGMIITCLLGLMIISSISKKFSLFEYIGLAFIVGIGTQTFLMFFLNFLGVKLSIGTILIVSVVGVIVLYFKFCQSLLPQIKQFKATKESILSIFGFDHKNRPNAIWLISLILTVYVVYAISVKSLFWTTFASDSVKSFDLFAKALAREGEIINSLIFENRIGPGVVYPPLYSMSLSYAYMLGFATTKIIPTLFFISSPFLFYSFLRRLANPTGAMFFTLFAMCTPELIAQSAINITSVPQAIYASLGVISFSIWLKGSRQDSHYLYLSVILLSLSAFIRNEGILYILPVLLYICYCFFKKNTISRKEFIIYLLVLLVPFVSWQLFFKIYGSMMEHLNAFVVNLAPNFDTENINKIWGLAKNVITSTQYYGLTLTIFIISVIVNIRNIITKKENIMILLCVFFLFFGYIALLNQLTVRIDTISNVVNFSGKRFFFGVMFLMWAYIATNKISRDLFGKLQNWLSLPIKTKK